MKTIKGITLAPGIAIGPTYYFERYKLQVPHYRIRPSEISQELIRLMKAISKSVSELTQIQELVSHHLDADHARMIEAQLMALTDEDLIEKVQQVIQKDHKNVIWAYYDIMTQYEKTLERTINAYQRERYIDLRDVKKRIIHHLLENQESFGPVLTTTSIFVSKKMTPSDLIQLHQQGAIGLITKVGGMDSHAAILARAFGIPYLSDVKDFKELGDDRLIVMDADAGKIILNPDDETVEKYQKIQQRSKDQRVRAAERQSVNATADGIPFHIQVNAGFRAEIEAIDCKLVEGIGLFRTEFMCIENNSIPDEDEQFDAYACVLEHMQGLEVTFRTFDFSHEKFVEILDIEMFHGSKLDGDLGGIHFMLENPTLLRIQLHALIRASALGPIRIMLPLVTSVDQVIKSKAMIREIQSEFQERGIHFDPDIKIGAMVETSAILDRLDELAREVDFFSIGTNDLALFLLHASREVNLTKNYYQPVLMQALQSIVQVAEQHRVPVSICGEMASDPYALIGLVALEIRSISINTGALQQVAEIIKNIDSRQAAELKPEILKAEDTFTLFQLLKEFYQKYLKNN